MPGHEVLCPLLAKLGLVRWEPNFNGWLPGDAYQTWEAVRAQYRVITVACRLVPPKEPAPMPSWLYAAAVLLGNEALQREWARW